MLLGISRQEGALDGVTRVSLGEHLLHDGCNLSVWTELAQRIDAGTSNPSVGILRSIEKRLLGGRAFNVAERVGQFLPYSPEFLLCKGLGQKVMVVLKFAFREMLDRTKPGRNRRRFEQLRPPQILRLRFLKIR